MHGGGGSENNYLGNGDRNTMFKKIFDKMIETKRCEPVIICAPSYYVPDQDDTVSAETFYQEFLDYLIPAFESKYNTYAGGDVTPEGIKASRLHRAFSGFSMGGVCTWTIFENCLDQVAYFLPMCGDDWVLVGQKGDPDAKAAALAEIANNAECGLDGFLLYPVAGGDIDVAYENVKPQVEAMEKLTDTFKYCDNFRDGNFCYCVEIHHGHGGTTVNHAMYTVIPTFFRLDTSVK